MPPLKYVRLGFTETTLMFIYFKRKHDNYNTANQ